MWNVHYIRNLSIKEYFRIKSNLPRTYRYPKIWNIQQVQVMNIYYYLNLQFGEVFTWQHQYLKRYIIVCTITMTVKTYLISIITTQQGRVISLCIISCVEMLWGGFFWENAVNVCLENTRLQICPQDQLHQFFKVPSIKTPLAFPPNIFIPKIANHVLSIMTAGDAFTRLNND